MGRWSVIKKFVYRSILIYVSIDRASYKIGIVVDFDDRSLFSIFKRYLKFQLGLHLTETP